MGRHLTCKDHEKPSVKHFLFTIPLYNATLLSTFLAVHSDSEGKSLVWGCRGHFAGRTSLPFTVHTIRKEGEESTGKKGKQPHCGTVMKQDLQSNTTSSSASVRITDDDSGLK